MTVSTLIRANGLKDEAKNHIQPVIVTGTAEELDAEFIAAVQQPISRASGLLRNMKEFEESADKAAANSKAEQEKKAKAEKEVKERKVNFDKHMKRGAELEKEQKYKDALTAYQQAKTVAEQSTAKSVEDKIRQMQNKLSQNSLFGLSQETVADTDPVPEEMPEEIYDPNEEYSENPDDEDPDENEFDNENGEGY